MLPTTRLALATGPRVLSLPLRSMIPIVPQPLPQRPTKSNPIIQNVSQTFVARRTFITTQNAAKKMSGPLNPNAGRGADKKIYLLRRWKAKRLPAPLRMARNRWLRHWTIHRAWLLYQRQERRRRELELMRMQQGISCALEELRRTSGPGTRPEGSLFYRAIERPGLWDMDAIPIEYARMQTDTPARIAWDHEWKAEEDFEWKGKKK